ncbi:MAG: formylglycine-generating enzyme family protein [Thermodesulfobacteriota bacterium]
MGRFAAMGLGLVFCVLALAPGCGEKKPGGLGERQLPPLKKDQKTTVNPLGMEFVYIEPGTFKMGSPEDEEGRQTGESQHDVTLSKGFWLQTTEVTQGQWEKVMHTYPSQFTNCGYDCPVENISWDQTQEFIRTLNEMDKKNHYRLPTEAEWEYACRAGTKTTFYYGECLGEDFANYDARYPLRKCPEQGYRGKTVRVKSFPPNAWGLYDMHGNVMEACQDWYDEFPLDNVTDPVGPYVGLRRVYRGGAWSNDAKFCRSGARGRYDPYQFSSLRGFRLVMDAAAGPVIPAAEKKPAEKTAEGKQ